MCRPPGRHSSCYRERVRHALFLALVAIYVLVVGQNWAYYSAALMIYTYDRYDGRWGTKPFTIG